MQAILDYRNARQAVELVNRGKEGFTDLLRNPHLVTLMHEIYLARKDPANTIDTMIDNLRDRFGTPELTSNEEED